MSGALRKKPVYQLRLSISVSIDELEEWLTYNCEGNYSYSLEGIKETDGLFKKLELLFSFDQESDRRKFKDAVRLGEF